MSYLTLDRLPFFKNACIYKINLTDDNSLRLKDLGFIEGEPIKSLFKSPFGDIQAYYILDSIIAIRKETAKKIEVII